MKSPSNLPLSIRETGVIDKLLRQIFIMPDSERANGQAWGTELMPRIIYQNWIVELGRDPETSPTGGPVGSESPRLGAIREAVAAALDRLSETEREFITRFYFMGQSYRELSEATGRPDFRFEGMHRRATRRLRALLGPFVREQFGLEVEQQPDCPICSSPQRREVDRLIAAKTARMTWRPIIRQLPLKYGISIATPHVLISHARYHTPAIESLTTTEKE